MTKIYEITAKAELGNESFIWNFGENEWRETTDGEQTSYASYEAAAADLDRAMRDSEGLIDVAVTSWEFEEEEDE